MPHERVRLCRQARERAADAEAEALAHIQRAHAYTTELREQAHLTALAAQEHRLAGSFAAALPLLQEVAGARLWCVMPAGPLCGFFDRPQPVTAGARSCDK